MTVTQKVACPACLNPDTLPAGYPGDMCDCQVCGFTWKLGPVLEIAGVHPAEYAAQWGDGSSSNGSLFYNCSHQARPGVVIANPDWTPDDWRRFYKVAHDQAGHVRYMAQTAEGRERTGWSLEDAGNLSLLATWARARIGGPQRFTYCNGESGAEIVRLSEEVVAGCSGSGAQDANVAAAMPGVEWLADADTIRKHPKGYGSWDADELADDDANRERALWVACCDCSEQPASYAD